MNNFENTPEYKAFMETQEPGTATKLANAHKEAFESCDTFSTGYYKLAEDLGMTREKLQQLTWVHHPSNRSYVRPVSGIRLLDSNATGFQQVYSEFPNAVATSRIKEVDGVWGLWYNKAEIDYSWTNTHR